MKPAACLAALAVVLCAACLSLPAKTKAPPEKAAAPKPPKGFVALFDGKTLHGWKGKADLWSVHDGMIVGDTTGHKLKHNQFLYTDKKYADFELRVMFKLRNHNSGIQIRSAVHPDYRLTGYQPDIAESRYTGMLYEEGGRGILAAVNPKVVAKHVHAGGWNQYRIVAKGNHIQAWINGFQTFDYTEKNPAKGARTGVIGFQLHAGPAMKVYFKDVYLKPL